VRDLNAVYRGYPALWGDELSWLHEDASGNTVAFLRTDVVCVFNFSGVHQSLYLPSVNGWREVLNTDAAAYGGTGAGNLGRVGSDLVYIGPHAALFLARA